MPILQPQQKINIAGYIQACRERDARFAQQWTDIDDLHNRKLWHELTVKLESLVEDQEFLSTFASLQFYSEFLADFEFKSSPSRIVNLILRVLSVLEDKAAVSSFLQDLALKYKHNDSCYIIIMSEVANLLLQTDIAACKNILNNLEEVVEKMPNPDNKVYSAYYRATSSYYKATAKYTEFYKDALKFLGCTELDSLGVAEQQYRAYDLALAALLASDQYNFGELLAHPVLNSLNNSEHAWLVEFLYIFNSGNLEKFQSSASTWRQQTELANNETKLFEKIRLLALMELVFKKPADSRAVSFSEIATTTSLPIEQVDFLLMRALSLGLIRGSIDGVGKTATISWVQPRVLDLSQIASMRDRLEQWCSRVAGASNFLEHENPELIIQ